MYVTKRSGFAMILAIFVVILVALGGVLLLGGATKTTKVSGDKYLHAQAELLARSATEYALMRAQGFNNIAGAGRNCLDTLTINVTDAAGATAMFNIVATMQYSFIGAAPAGACNVLNAFTGKDTTVLIDVVVTDVGLSTEPIRVHERSWQKL